MELVIDTAFVRRAIVRAAWVLLAPVIGAAGTAAADWTAEFLLGGAVNARSDLTITQAGQPDLEFSADWSTRPFEQPLYWALRAGWEGDRHGWALDLHHHKLILENGPPEVETFTVTHGTNLVTVQHTWLRPRWRWLVLAGVVIAHPENTVRGERLPESGGLFGAGYQLAGPVIGGGVATAWPISGSFEIVLEGRITHAWMNVDVVGGEARFRNLAFHLLVGPRLRI